MAVGDEVELAVLRVAHGGVSVAELDGRVVLVADTLPGERVLARVTDDRHERFWRADTVRVLDASPDRRPHVWAAADVDRDPAARAGGAELGHVAPARQRALKGEVLRDALRRTGRLSEDAIAALDTTVHAVPGEPDGRASRTRVRLHVDAEGRVGPFAVRSRQVVPVTDLPLAVPAAARLLPEHAAGDWLELVASADGAQRIGPGAHPAPVVERVEGRDFRVEARGFWQVHPAAPTVLRDAVQAAIDPAAFDPAAGNLDLYGGVGLLAASLADAGGAGTAVTTVESDRRASAHAGTNLRDLPGAHAVADRVDRFLARSRPRPGATVVLDPPRSGAGAAAVRGIAALDPAQVVYVACDPVALARDLATFRDLGWVPERLTAFDLFPNTHHLEAVVALARG